MDFKQLALAALKRNPNVANSPQGRQFMQILESGDDAAGMQMAQNLCRSYGVSQDDAIAKVKEFFNL